MTEDASVSYVETPYQGIRVLDLGQGVAGPYCTEILAQQGADVIKIEPPNGDWVRNLVGSREGIGPLSIFSNLGKRSICLDISKPEGARALKVLAKHADVLVESSRPGVMQKLGLGYQELSADHSDLIYASISAFGESGPYTNKPGSDSVMQAFTGMAALNRDQNGTPQRLPILVPDVGTAVYAAQAVGAALFARLRTGRGQHLHLSLLQCSLAFQAGNILESLLSGDTSMSAARLVPYGVFATADGHIVLLALHEKMWRQFCNAIDCEHWLKEPRYATLDERRKHLDEIQSAIAQILTARTTAEWVNKFEQHDVLCAPTLRHKDLLTHPQVTHMDCFAEIEQPPWGKLPVPNLPFRTQKPATYCTPHIGEHSRQILAEAGYSEKDIARLEHDDIVKQYSPAAQ